VAMLHSELVFNLKHPKPKPDMYGVVVESRRTPVYYVTTSNPHARSIQLSCLPPSVPDHVPDPRPPKRLKAVHLSAEPLAVDSESSMITPSTSEDDGGDCISEPQSTEKYKHENLNDLLPSGDLVLPHVLVSLALDGEQFLDVAAWNKWLSECPSFAKYARVEGMFKSHSTLLLLSIPIAIWDLLPDQLACSFIAYVGSVNHIKGFSEPSNNIPGSSPKETGCDKGGQQRSNLLKDNVIFSASQSDGKKSADIDSATLIKNQYRHQSAFTLHTETQESIQEQQFHTDDSISSGDIKGEQNMVRQPTLEDLGDAGSIHDINFRERDGLVIAVSFLSFSFGFERSAMDFQLCGLIFDLV
jgi:hypothetical protein